MKTVVSAALAALVLVGFVPAQDKKDEKKFDAAKLLGVWELTKSTDEGAPKGAIVEFKDGGKLTIAVDFNGKKLELTGSYKVEGDKLTVSIKAPDSDKEESDTDTIKSLDGEKIVLIDKKGKETELTRKKK